MSLRGLALGTAIIFQNTMKEANNKLQEDIDKNVKDYWNACNLPRKTKKRVRKQIIKEYNLNMSILNWNKEFNFGI